MALCYLFPENVALHYVFLQNVALRYLFPENVVLCYLLHENVVLCYLFRENVVLHFLFLENVNVHELAVWYSEKCSVTLWTILGIFYPLRTKEKVVVRDHHAVHVSLRFSFGTT